MPTYEYVCAGCGHEFELEQRISEPPAKKCPKCGKLKAHRQISSGNKNFILKGGGWYSDLYSSQSRPSTSKGDDGGAPKGETKTTAESKTETTPSSESKAEAKTSSESKKSDSKKKAAQ